MGIRPIPSFAILSLSLSLCVSSSKLIPPSFIVTRNVHVFLSRRKRRAEVGGKRGVRKSVSVGVCSNALATRSRLSKRTESHSREHLWSLPASLLFFFTLLRLPPSLSRSLSLPRHDPGGLSSVTYLFCYLRLIGRSFGIHGRFKGISTIFESGFHTPRGT